MIRGIWARCVLLVATMLLALPTAIVTLLVPRWGNLVMVTGKLWSRIMLTAVGARVTYHGLDRIDDKAPRIFIANHLSMIDIWVMLTLIPPSTRFVAKQELFRIPVFGWALAGAGSIPINRSNRKEAIRSLGLAAERIRAGRSVVLFPEGTRSRDGRLQPFKKGAFHLAVRAGVPVTPVAITGSFDVMSPASFRIVPGPVDVYVEPLIDVEPYRPADPAGLMSVVHATIERRFRTPPEAP